MTKVIVLEYERGWGKRIVDEPVFVTTAEAEQYVKTFNARNTAQEAPDYYLQASIVEIDGHAVW